MLYEGWAWGAIAAIALMQVDTGGGGYVGRNAEAGGDFAGRDININASQDDWRIYVNARLREHDARIAHIERTNVYQQIIWACVALAFVLSMIVSAGIIVRRFDQIELQSSAQIENLSRQLERQLDRIQRQLDMQRVP